MSDDDRPASRQDHSRESSFVRDAGILRPFVVATLATALVMGLIVVIRLAAPNPAWRLLPVAVFLIALEGVYTSRWLADPQRRQFNRHAYRLAELAVIAVALRLLTWFLSGGIPGWEVWRTYLLSPLTFFDGVYFAYLLCGLFAWERAVSFGDFLRGLSISESEEIFYTLPYNEQRQRSFDRPIDRERPSLFRSLVSNWLGGGLLLGLTAAMSTVDLAAIEVIGGVRNVIRLGLNSSILLALLVYFILGLWVISQARLDMMRARWLADGVRADEAIVNTWRRTSIAILALFALIAAFLPIGSTFAAAVVLQAVVAVVVAVMQLLFLLFTTLLVAVVSLLGLRPFPQETAQLPDAPGPTPLPPQGAPLDETTALFAGGVFWILVTLVAVVAIFFFLRDRGVRLRYKPLVTLLTRLRNWLRQLGFGLARRAGNVQLALRRGLERILPAAEKEKSPWRFLRVNALPPREQIRYFYLSTVRRAADEGLPREKSETPSEYAGDLQAQWPEASEEIEALTGAFLEARYSPREFEPEEVNPIKKVWKRARRALRHRLTD